MPAILPFGKRLPRSGRGKTRRRLLGRHALRRDKRCARDSAFWEEVSQRRRRQDAQAAFRPPCPEKGASAVPAILPFKNWLPNKTLLRSKARRAGSSGAGPAFTFLYIVYHASGQKKTDRCCPVCWFSQVTDAMCRRNSPVPRWGPPLGCGSQGWRRSDGRQPYT